MYDYRTRETRVRWEGEKREQLGSNLSSRHHARWPLSGNSDWFAPYGSSAEAEEGSLLSPKFDADGLLTCIATDAGTGEVLMVAHMNAQALIKTITTGEAWYFSGRARPCGAKERLRPLPARRRDAGRLRSGRDPAQGRAGGQGRLSHWTAIRFYRAVPLGPKGSGPVTLEFRGARRHSIRMPCMASEEALNGSSCPALCRASTISPNCIEGVDGRDEPGHDD